jgi:hypothetical protein
VVWGTVRWNLVRYLDGREEASPVRLRNSAVREGEAKGKVVGEKNRGRGKGPPLGGLG